MRLRPSFVVIGQGDALQSVQGFSGLVSLSQLAETLIAWVVNPSYSRTAVLITRISFDEHSAARVVSNSAKR